MARKKAQHKTSLFHKPIPPRLVLPVISIAALLLVPVIYAISILISPHKPTVQPSASNSLAPAFQPSSPTHPSESPIPTDPPRVDDPVRPGWKIYTNSAFKISFSYPASRFPYVSVEDETDKSFTIIFSTVKLSHGYSLNDEGVVKIFVKGYHPSPFATELAFFDSPKADQYYYDRKWVTVDGEVGYIYTDMHNSLPKGTDASNTNYRAMIEHNGYGYEFEMETFQTSVLLSYVPTFEEIFSTVRFGR